jgi:hypothetical protein
MKTRAAGYIRVSQERNVGRYGLGAQEVDGGVRVDGAFLFHLVLNADDHAGPGEPEPLPVEVQAVVKGRQRDERELPRLPVVADVDVGMKQLALLALPHAEIGHEFPRAGLLFLFAHQSSSRRFPRAAGSSSPEGGRSGRSPLRLAGGFL